MKADNRGKLTRSLALRHVFALSTGAMLSSGLFLLFFPFIFILSVHEVLSIFIQYSCYIRMEKTVVWLAQLNILL